ncbi:tripeptidyl-peptidase sed1 [Trichoderma asperellum]|uniref:tripeptidyl-peptidase II n=1 Tax=Trichoderma asperellum TaxID=101201 RepID=A0A6V8R2U4_TRIAP|nr:peptidase S8/S53 domain-containing protein [Trichoderma asperelloides]GFP58602.1 tripeptidyl-peptidase sed1 [Trichoderma asperellum]
MKISLVVLNSLLAGAIAVPTGSQVIHEKRDTNNPRWIKREALSPSTQVPVRIALKQNNLDKGMDYLLAVSHPDSANYGKHYSSDQVVELFAPSEDSISAVKSWLVKSGVPASSITSSKSKGWLDFVTTSGQLESLLKTSYSTYDHVEARNVHIGTDEYSLPNEISQHIDFITPGVVFAPMKRTSKAEKREHKSIRQPSKKLPAHIAQLLAANPLATSSCGTAITPQCIKSMYNITSGTSAISTNALGIFETEDTYAQQDLTSFWKAFATNIPSNTGPKVDAIDGATAPTSVGNAGGESDLDFEIAIPIIYPQTTVLYQAAVKNDDIFNTFLDAIDGSYCTFSDDGETGDDPTVDGTTRNEMCGTFKPTNVISFSYGTAEADYPTYYLERQCDEFMKLGLQGTSIVFASGDDGVARRSGACLGSKHNIFTPGEPASCPYVTSVGATTLPSGKVPGDAETAVTSFSSGGGFSNIWTTPSYQASAVASYFASHNPTYASYNTSGGVIPTTGGIYNKAGRGYPDVSAVGDNGVVVNEGEQVLEGGTSMSAPLFAAILTRINEERITAGKSPVGFVNPALYSNPSMFNDITVGNQAKGGPNGDGAASACGNTGFSAVTGWDPVTGLGTPNYPEMLTYFLSLS